MNNSNQQPNLNIKNENASIIKIIHTIKGQHDGGITSICELKDKRLVSSSYDYSIIIYNHLYKPQIHIKNAHDNFILSLYILENGELVSSSWDKTIKIWRINENDYNLIHILKGHDDVVWKIIELEDGKIISCSSDETIKIWDNYQCIQNLKGNSDEINSIIEMNNYIISASEDKTLRIWDESTYQSVTTIMKIHCLCWNGLSKMNKDTLLVGGENTLYIIDIQTCEANKIEVQSSGWINCFIVLKNGLILFGTEYGEIFCYDSSTKQFILRKKFHNEEILCLIES